MLVQTPPLQVAPKYIPVFCVVDEDAGLDTTSIRRNVCRTKDANGVRKTPELTVRESRSGVGQAFFTSRAHKNYAPPPLFARKLAICLQNASSIVFKMFRLSFDTSEMVAVQHDTHSGLYTKLHVGYRPLYEISKAFVQMSTANKAIKLHNEQTQL